MPWYLRRYMAAGIVVLQLKCNRALILATLCGTKYVVSHYTKATSNSQGPTHRVYVSMLAKQSERGWNYTPHECMYIIIKLKHVVR